MAVCIVDILNFNRIKPSHLDFYVPFALVFIVLVWLSQTII